MDQNDPPQLNHPISASYGSSSGDNLADVLSGGMPPRQNTSVSKLENFTLALLGNIHPAVTAASKIFLCIKGL
jgi:hypothetical protein